MNNTTPTKGITFSTFDLLHAGHIMMLQEAATLCDWLIVGLHVDPQVERPEKNAPVQSVVERYIQLSDCASVNQIVPYNTEQDLHDMLCCYVPDVRIIGDDYRDTNFSGKDICDRLNIHIHYNSRKHRWSSSGLRAHVQQLENQKNNK